MSLSTFYVLLIALLLSMACTSPKPQTLNQPAQTAPAAMDAKGLMKLAFPDAQDGKCRVTLPDWESHEPERFRLEALACAPLGADWLVLVANAVPLTDDGYVQNYHALGGLLNLIWFRRANNGWEVVGHEKNLAPVGSCENLGTLNFHPFPGGRLVLSVEDSWSGMGLTLGTLHLFELVPEHSHSLIESIKSSGNNLRDCPPETCYSITNAFSFAADASLGHDANYPDLVIQFEGTESRFSGKRDDPEERPCCDAPGWEVIKTIKERAVYRYREGAYQLVEGINPVDEKEF